jgi:hypothetical protein
LTVPPAGLRDDGIVESFPDPADRRRTLVRVGAQHPRNVMRAAMVPVDAALTDALGDLSPDEAADIIVTLEALSALLRPRPKTRTTSSAIQTAIPAASRGRAGTCHTVRPRSD